MAAAAARSVGAPPWRHVAAQDADSSHGGGGRGRTGCSHVRCVRGGGGGGIGGHGVRGSSGCSRQSVEKGRHDFRLFARKGGDQESYPAMKKKREAEPEVDLDVDFDDISDEELLSMFDLPFQSDLAVQPRHYECVFLIHEDYFEQVPEIIQKVKAKITEFKGTVWRLNDWGLRKMAYKIKKASKANYILLNVEVMPPQINEFEKMLLDDERIIRHLIFKKKGPETEDYPPPPTWEQMTRSESMVDDDEEENEDEEEEEEEELVGNGKGGPNSKTMGTIERRQ